jgi:hypothetical protein
MEKYGMKGTMDASPVTEIALVSAEELGKHARRTEEDRQKSNEEPFEPATTVKDDPTPPSEHAVGEKGLQQSLRWMLWTCGKDIRRYR